MQGVQGGVTNSELRVRVHSVGTARELRFPSTQTVWLGRDQTCEVALASQEVSRRHVSLFVKEGELFVRDHSTYGTRVNGQPLQLAVRAVASPVLVQVGPYCVEVTLAGDVLGVRLLPELPLFSRFSALGGRLLALGLSLGLGLWLAAGFVAPDRSGAPVEVAVEKRCPQPSADALAGASPLRAAQLLHAGDRVAALHVYQALAMRDDSRAELSIVAELLAREFACRL